MQPLLNNGAEAGHDSHLFEVLFQTGVGSEQVIGRVH